MPAPAAISALPSQIVTPFKFNKSSSFDIAITSVIIPCQDSGVRNAAEMNTVRVGPGPRDH